MKNFDYKKILGMYQKIDSVSEETLATLHQELKGPKSCVEKLKISYALGEKVPAFAPNGVDILVTNTAFIVKVIAAFETISAADIELDGCVMRLYDYILNNMDNPDALTIKEVIENYLYLFFNDEEMFWEAYKTLFLADVISPNYTLGFTLIGLAISELRNDSKN